MVALKGDTVLLPQKDGKIVARGLVVQEVVLDNTPLVTETENKTAKAIMGIDFHDMPDDRFAAHFHHRFGFELRFFTKSCSHTAAENYYRNIFLHRNSFCF